MAGKRAAAQVVVDPIAAAEQLESPEEVPEGLDQVDLQSSPAPGLLQRVHDAAALASEVAQNTAGAMCALGHSNDPAAQFCASCGLLMSAQAPPAAVEVSRPKPASELSDTERAERDRQHAEALAAARQFETAPVTYVPSEGEAVLVHFIEDGLTAFGQVWYRGQEIEIGPGHPRWDQARAWILLDRAAQIDRWGKQFFAPGPWPGRRSYLDGSDAFEQLAAEGGGKFRGPGEQALRQADEAERRRGRAVPASLR